MKRFTIIAVLAVLALTISASAQTATGTLSVTATVGGSISLAFNSDAAGVALGSGAGTSTATLAFGNVSAYGAIAGTITRSVVAGTSFTVSTPVDVNVTRANSASANYTLKAQLGTADAVNTWKIGGVTITNASATQITATGAYNTNVSEAVALTIPFSVTTNISNTVNFTATSN